MVLFGIQLLVTCIVGIYFYTQLRSQQKSQPSHRRDSGRELEKLQKLRTLRLSEPLAEKVRPAKFSDIVGQEDGIKSLKAILCGKNPQHVIIYGPPGIGKTCAARLVLEAAKKSPGTPFRSNAPFIEMDATCVRFDERAIADPLIGSVHDPIYQGAGPLGVQGVPQPKPGAVTKAHGGVLFLDEIGELHPIQMNKLLKVLQSLVDKGNTVIVIEHNLDVIKEADWLIDLGPEGGDGGGTIVTQGTPEQVAECEASWTGKFLKPML